MIYKIRFVKPIKGSTIVSGSSITCRDFSVNLHDRFELAVFVRMLVDNHSKFETEIELKGSIPKIYVWCDEEDQNEFKAICDVLKKQVFNDNENISFLEINAGILQETYKKY